MNYVACAKLACENSRPSSLPARRETLLGPGAKKVGCFRRLALNSTNPPLTTFEKNRLGEEKDTKVSNSFKNL